MKSIDKFATDYSQDKYLPVQTSQAVKAGANYVLDIIEQALTPQKCLTDIGIDVCPEALIKTALQTIEELKEEK